MPEIYVHADQVLPGAWRVEVIDADGRGACAVTIFTGHQAQSAGAGIRRLAGVTAAGIR